VRRLRGGVKLAGVRGGAAAAFYSVGARREQKKERNRSLGSLRCSCARWKGSWGSAASSPRRRRGGGREEVLGAWHGRWRASAKPRSGGGDSGRRVGDSATEKRRPGSLSTAPASVPSVGGGAEQSREVEMEIRVDL